MQGPLLRLVEVHKSFGPRASPVAVLQGVSFEIDPGESVCITGPSGSGKSTLLHLIGGLDLPTSGRIEVAGLSPHELPEPERARFRNRTIGFIFQEAHLLPQYTVLENVLLPTLAFSRARDGSDARARELLRRVGLVERLDHRPAELSGGERQRVAVARALINSPRLLLCDEPTGSVDGKTAEAVGTLLLELPRQEAVALLVATHSEALAGRIERRLELREGRCYER